MEKIKILFILPHLRPGGAEKVITFLINKINKKKFEVQLLVIGSLKDNHYKLKNINVVYLNKNRLRCAFLNIFEYINKSDFKIVFSSIYHINLYLGFLSFFFNKTKFITREANILSVRRNFSPKTLMPDLLKKIIYKNLDCIIFQSNDMQNDFLSKYRLNNKCKLINNPVTISNKPKLSYSIHGDLKFLNIGSLEEKKGHFRLIEFFEKIERKYKLSVYGQGKLEKDLINHINKNNLNANILLKGISKNLNSIFSHHNFYIQGSYVEGFPNALLEALSYGLPSLVFKSPGGHNEIIIEGFNGYFIEEGVNEQIIFKKFINRKWDRKAIQEDIFKRFNSKKIINQYESLFLNITI